MNKERIIRYCDKSIELSLYAVAFFIPISTAFIEIFIGLAIVAWLIKKIITKAHLKTLFYRTPLNIPILLYVLACLVSSFFSSNQVISFKHLIFKTVEYLLLFYIVAETLDKKILRNVLIALVFSVGLVGIDGISQYFTHFDFLRHRNQVIAGRINGPFGTPNDFSNYIVSLLPIVASLSFLKFRKLWIKSVLIIVSLILGICLIFSATRSAWTAFLLAIPFAAIFGNKKLFILGLLVIAIVFSTLLLIPNTEQRRIIPLFYFNEATQVSQRPFLWRMSWNMFLDRPILGQGLGTFMHNFERFKPHNYPENWGISYAHNCFLQMASETGVLGLLTFISIIAVLFFNAFKLLRRKKEDTFYYYVLSGLLTGICTYLVSSFFDTNLYSLPLTVLFWLMVGLTVGVTKIITLELI